MRKEKQLRLLNEMEKNYKLTNYQNEDGQTDFFNYFNDYYAALCKVFGKTPLKNECPEVAEARKTLMLAVYEERKNKSIIDLKMESMHKEFSAEYKTHNNECYEKLVATYNKK